MNEMYLRSIIKDKYIKLALQDVIHESVQEVIIVDMIDNMVDRLV